MPQTLPQRRTLAARASVSSLIFALACVPLAAFADTAPSAGPTASPVRLVIDGRPVLRTKAVSVGGVIYVELVGIVRTFSGLVVFDKSTSTVSIGSRVAIFTVGSARANVDGTMLAMAGKTFEATGDRYVPLAFFAHRLAHAGYRLSADGKSVGITSQPHDAAAAAPTSSPISN